MHRLRRSARVFLFDPGGRILLIRFVAELEGKGFVFWVTPGGEVEAGETDLAAAKRELFEELGLHLPLTGPVHEESGGTYTHLGETVRNFDVFFAAVCDTAAPQLKGVTMEEIALMHEIRWQCGSGMGSSTRVSVDCDRVARGRAVRLDHLTILVRIGSEQAKASIERRQASL